MHENQYILKPRLLPQLRANQWEYGISIYDEKSNDDGLILCIKIENSVNDNFDLINDFNNVQLYRQHRLIKISNVYFEVVDFYYTGQNYGTISQINKNEYDNMEDIKLNNHGIITEIFKEMTYDMVNNIYYFFSITIEYNESQKKQKCYVNYHHN